jgi:hypothetical protein
MVAAVAFEGDRDAEDEPGDRLGGHLAGLRGHPADQLGDEFMDAVGGAADVDGRVEPQQSF